jgi:hypothetical protein
MMAIIKSALNWVDELINPPPLTLSQKMIFMDIPKRYSKRAQTMTIEKQIDETLLYIRERLIQSGACEYGHVVVRRAIWSTTASWSLSAGLIKTEFTIDAPSLEKLLALGREAADDLLNQDANLAAILGIEKEPANA